MKVLLVNVQALSLGYIGAYGNDWIETPTLDDLAAESVVFDFHIADRPDVSGACTAWRTGCYDLPDEGPSSIGRPSRPIPDLLSELRAAKVATMLVRDSRPTLPERFLTGWDRIFAPNAGDEEDPLSSTIEAALEGLEWLENSSQGLLCVNVGSLLPPWRAPAEFAERHFGNGSDDAEERSAATEPLTAPSAGYLDPADLAGWQRLQRSYAGLVTYVDAGLGALWDIVRERGLEDEICLIVTADHGFPLGEHKTVGFDRPWLHEELVHVPLIVRLPGAMEATRRVLALTQPVDLPPTLLDLFGLPPVPMHGQSLVPIWQGKAAEIRAYAVSGSHVGERVEWALRTPAWALLLPVFQEVEDEPRPRQLYVKPADRWELNNLVQHHAALADRLEQVLRGFVHMSRGAEAFEPPALAQGDGG